MKSSSQPQPRVLIPKKIGTSIAKGEIYACSGYCMGTSWNVRFVAEGPVDISAVEACLCALLERIEEQMSHFRPHSDLRRFSALPAGEHLILPDEFARVLRVALDVAQQSDGAFDPSIAKLVDEWGFGRGTKYSDANFFPPSADRQHKHAAHWKDLKIDAQNHLIQPGNVSLNLAAIAKGFAVDVLAQHLTESGWKNHLVEIGGELRGSGVKPDGQPWWVALEPPGKDCTLPSSRIALHGLSVATSGNYRRSYQIGNRRFQHTIDPKTGMPLTHRLSSVSVLHQDCLYADAWATAIMVKGNQQGLELAEKMNLYALLQGTDEHGNWTEVASSAWKSLQQ